LRDTATLCESLGHDVAEADPAIDAELVVPTFLTIAAVNSVVSLASHPTKKRPPREDEVERVTFATAKLGEAIASSDYVRRDADNASTGSPDGRLPSRVGCAARARARDSAAAWMDRHDDGRRPRILEAARPWFDRLPPAVATR
jgi:hypothetical protein